jgi:hypothetical protein
MLKSILGWWSRRKREQQKELRRKMRLRVAAGLKLRRRRQKSGVRRVQKQKRPSHAKRKSKRWSAGRL